MASLDCHCMTERATAPAAARVPQLFPVIVPAPAPERHAGAYIAYAAICIIWGTTFVAIRVAIETIPTLLVTSVRFVFAGLILLLIAGMTGARFPKRAHEWRA